MNKLNRNRLIAILLIIIMPLTIAPGTAFAAGEPPELLSAEVTSTGHVELTFDKEMAAPDTGAAGFLVVGYAGQNKNVTAAQLDGDDPAKILLTLDITIKGGETTPWLGYTPGTVAAADGGLLTGFDNFEITNTLPHPTLDTTSLLDGTVGTLYTHTFTATDGTTPFNFYLEIGSLPIGLSLNQTTGVLNGTPEAPGNFTFDVRVSDSNSAFDRKSFSLKINPIATNVCTISGGGSYTSLEAAFIDVQDGQTITLLQNINHNQGITIDGETVTLNLAGYTLNVTNSSGTGLEVQNGGKLLLFDSSGEFNVTGSTNGVHVVGSGSEAEVTNATGTYGAYAFDGGWITIRNNATGEGASGIAANARDGGLITIMGSAIGEVYGVFVADSSGGTNASVSVGGNVSGQQGICVSGTDSSNTSVSVTGHVIATGSGTTSYGVFANGSNTNAEIEGDVTAASSVGAWADNGGEITIGGEITATDYIKVGSTTKTAAEKTLPTTKPDYHTYTDSTSTVWMKDTSTPPSGSTGTAVWHYRSPMPANDIIERIEFINGKYFAVGYNSTLISSSDGVSWQKISVGTDIDRLSGIAYGNGKYVVVGFVDSYVGRIYTSDDGLNWQETTAFPHHWIHDVAFGNGKFVAVGEAGKILTSTDGDDWDIITIPNNDYTLLSVTYGEGVFVASGMGATTAKPKGGIMTSVDGSTWTVKHINNIYTLWDVTYGEDTFVATGCTNEGSHYICSSSDGDTWTQRITGGSGRLFSVDYDGSKFIAVGRTFEDKALYTASVDGTSWTGGSDTATPGLRAVASNAAGTRYVAMGGYGNIYTSDNGGTSWNDRTGGTTQTLRDVAYNGSDLYVAVGLNGTIQTSSNGQDWTLQISGTTNHLNKVDYLGGQFIAVGTNGTILTSSNGTDWTNQNSGGTTQSLKGVAYGDGRYVVVGGDAEYNPVVLYSTDGVTWVSDSTSGIIGITFVSIAYGEGVFIAVMKNGQAYQYQYDSDTHEFISTRVANLAGSGCYPADIIYAGGKFAAVGGYGEVYLSSNKGTSWTKLDTDFDSYSYGIAYGDGNFAAVGEIGKIIASADGGETWFVQPSGLIPNHYSSDNHLLLNGIVAGDSCFIAVGEDGIVLQSESFTVSADADANDVAVAKAALQIDGSGSNNIPGYIIAYLILTTEGSKDTTIRWQSSKPQYVASDGTVTRPTFADGDQVVYLTATITKGAASETKTFIVDVIAQPNSDISDVAAAATALTFDTIKLTNTTSNNITSNLNLITSGINGTTITWASNQPTYITTGGAVTRPAQGTSDQTVTLTATIAKGSASQTKQFTLTVIAMVDQAAQDALDVAAAIAALSFNTIKGSNIEAESITSNLNLTTSGINGTSISWSSNNTAYLTTGGAVTRPAQGAADEDVILIATITKGSASQTKQFTVRVKAKSSAPTPENNSGSGSSSTPSPSYNADVSGTGTSDTLPVSVNTVSNNASVTAGPELGDSVAGGDPVVIIVPTIPGVHSFTLEIPVDYLSDSDSDGVLTFTTDTGSITIPSNMLTNTEGEKAKIRISERDATKLTGDVKAAIGDRPLVQLTLTLDGKQTAWNNPAAPVTVSIPYTPTTAELANPEGIVIWYIDGSGDAICVPNGRYDPDTGSVTFTTTHFSEYAVVYNKTGFNDVATGVWYYKPISFIASRDITAGTGGGNFSPNAKLTRGQFIVMLMKAYGISPDANPKDSFSDAGSTYYTGYLTAAKRLGITNGVGNNMFAPSKEITRQETLTLLYNALKIIDELPKGTSGKTLSDFSDAVLVKSWAKDAITLLTETGTIGGYAGKVNPAATTTRAEMAQLLYNLLSK